MNDNEKHIEKKETQFEHTPVYIFEDPAKVAQEGGASHQQPNLYACASWAADGAGAAHGIHVH